MKTLIRRLIFILCAMLALSQMPPAAHATGSTAAEYKVKAAFLYNFVKFISWPDQSFSSEPVVNLCIMGNNPFGEQLALIENKQVGGRSLRIIQDVKAADAPSCHIVFVSKTQNKQASALIAHLKDQPILTVGDTAGFARNGGIINFTVIQGRVKLEINSVAARHAGLSIDPALLEVAHKVFSQ